MSRLDALRLATWSIPFALAYITVLVRRPTRAQLAGPLVATVWAFWTILAVNVLAAHLGWWEFARGLPSLLGVPVEPLAGWVVLWGFVAPVAGLDRPKAVTIVALLWLDLIAMPLMAPLVVLGDAWPAGEAISLAVTLVPALYFSSWTAGGTHLERRALLQVVTAVAIFGWFVPSFALQSHGGWDHAIDSLGSFSARLWIQAALLPAALGLRAVAEFVRRGRGTPIPYDPPSALVESGPYSYLRNPMQLAVVLWFGLSALVLQDPVLLGAAVLAIAYSAGLAEWHENVQLDVRFGADWARYRSHVRAWIPRFRPYVDNDATLLVAFSCGTCSSIGQWFEARNPVGLTIAPAESATGAPLRRVTYVSPAGPRAEGVAAIAHALEHVHIGWAIVGWIMLLPGIRHVAQLLADVCGPGPQVVAGSPYDADACRIGR